MSTIQELDLVAIVVDQSALRLRRGDVGTVVHIYEGSDLYEVEFVNARGETVGVETLSADVVMAVGLDHVTMHYNDAVGAV